MIENILVKCTFLELLEREFGVRLQETEPEESSLPYLLEHKILIQIQEKLLYFSRIKYADGLKKLDGQNGSQNATGLQQR